MNGRQALCVIAAALAIAACGGGAPEPADPPARAFERSAELTARIEVMAARTARLAGIVQAPPADPAQQPARTPLERHGVTMADHADALVRAAAALVLELRALEASPELLQDPATVRRAGEIEDELEAIVGALERLVASLEELAPHPAPAPTAPAGD